MKPPETKAPDEGLARVRVLAIRANVALIAFVVVFPAVTMVSIDLGVLATLGGIQLALLGLGPLLKLPGSK